LFTSLHSFNLRNRRLLVTTKIELKAIDAGGQHRLYKGERSGRGEDDVVEKGPEQVLFDRPHHGL